MKRAYVLAAFGAVVGCFVAMAACSGDDSTGPTGGGKTDTGVGSDTATTEDTGTGTETSTDDTGGTTTETGTPVCPMVLKEGKIAELRDPASSKKVIVNDGVKLTGVVATSQRFLTDTPSKAGDACPYGVFVADANATFAPYSGMLVIYYGKNAVATDAGKASCPKDDTSVLIPADTKPGDVFDISGTYTEFGTTAANCAKLTNPDGGTGLPPPVPTKMPELFKVCALSRTSTSGTAPAPADVAPADIAQQTGDGAALLKWAGGLVRVKNVKTDDTKLFFGSFKISGSELWVTDTVFFRGASTAPTISAGQEFDSITGLSYLNICTWSLAPSQCADMVPKTGTVCPATGDAGPGDTGTSD